MMLLRTRVLAPLAFVVFLAACVATLSGDWASLFSLNALVRMGEFARGFAPPAMDPPFLARTASPRWKRSRSRCWARCSPCIGGLALALPAAGRWGVPARVAARSVLNVARAIPELVWASMIVVAAGLGPFAGTLALAFHTTGVLGRLFAESLENVPPEANEALRRNGASATQAFWYSTCRRPCRN